MMLGIKWETIERKWQKIWEERRAFEADPEPERPKWFITVAYPYPNSPQHVGHGRTYTITDIYARFKRMQGFNVLLPMAFHYTGTPILAMSERVASGDRDLINDFVEIYHVPREIVQTFSNPLALAKYFHEEIKQGMKEMGYSIDWRREFTTVDGRYSRFIQWQFKKLSERGFVIRGSHPVGWCPNNESPVGQHDTVGDVEPEVGEYTLIKFELEGSHLPTATLRPETVFGVTNIWINPKVDYVLVKVDGDHWIVSKRCVDKLRLLEREVEIVREVKGESLLGKLVKNPVTGKKVPILPADFADPNNATGVVMSVPGHAPYDYVALAELKKKIDQHPALIGKKSTIRQIEPISIIELRGFSDLPARDVVEKLGIKTQTDAKLVEATKEVYSREFHGGVMKENTGPFAGLKVSEARERVKERLLSEGKADTMYELLNRPVFCRCGSECMVKVFKKQWFINYGQREWKDLAHECLNQMAIVPSVLRDEFKNVIEWLRERACARKRGLGTKLPWETEWIIESLSDSVIYMAYYILAKYMNAYAIREDQLTDEVFDYVFLGKGNVETISAKTGLATDLLRSMREEFLYFYPVDSRHSGRDLVPNHLTFYIFNHVAIFPRELWPRQIVTNGSVLMGGKKMSKSFGNIIPLRDAVRDYGSDPIRLAVVSTAEVLQDASFSPELAKSVGEQLEEFYSLALKIIAMRERASEGKLASVDKWMLGMLQRRVKWVTESLESLRVREAVQQAFYLLNQDQQWYLRRTAIEGEERSRVVAKVLNEVLDVRVRLLAPFVPHLCEEIWSSMGRDGLVSLATWPSYDEKAIDLKAMKEEEVVRGVVEDVSKILKVVKRRPSKVCLYVASNVKWEAYLKALQVLKEKARAEKLRVKEGKMVGELMRTVVKLSPEEREERRIVGRLDEFSTLTAAKAFLERELKAKVCVFREEDPNRCDPEDRAKMALPYRPAIYVE